MNTRYQEEIDRLYLQMYRMLFEYARSSLSNDALAEEAVQDTFIIACQKPEALCNSPNPAGWLVKTLKNVLSNTIRSQNIAKQILTDYCAANNKDIAISEDQLDLDVLYGNIAYSEEFKLLKELVIDGKSYLELADERHISVDTCRKRVERAKRLLRKSF